MAQNRRYPDIERRKFTTGISDTPAGPDHPRTVVTMHDTYPALQNPVISPARINDVAKSVKDQVRAAHDAGVTLEQLATLYPTLEPQWIEEFCKPPAGAPDSNSGC